MATALGDSFNALKNILIDTERLYRQLLEVVKFERELLLSPIAEKIALNNQNKDAILQNLSNLEIQRIQACKNLAMICGITEENPRLNDLVNNIDISYAHQLVHFRQTLTSLFEEVTAINKENQIYAESGLKTLSGAIDSLRDSISGKKTYERKGHFKATAQAGHLVSKEA